MMHVPVHTTLNRVRSTCACHTDTAAARTISVNILATILENCGYFVFDRQTTLQPAKAVWAGITLTHCPVFGAVKHTKCSNVRLG